MIFLHQNIIYHMRLSFKGFDGLEGGCYFGQTMSKVLYGCYLVGLTFPLINKTCTVWLIVWVCHPYRYHSWVVPWVVWFIYFWLGCIFPFRRPIWLHGYLSLEVFQLQLEISEVLLSFLGLPEEFDWPRDGLGGKKEEDVPCKHNLISLN